MALAKSQRSLRAWTRQKWRTKSGKPSTQGSKATGERYLPEKAIKALSSSEYSKTTALKRKAIRAGKQVSKQPKKIARKTKSYRSYSQVKTMMNIYFELFKFFNKLGNYFYNKYCRTLHNKQVNRKTRVVKQEVE